MSLSRRRLSNLPRASFYAVLCMGVAVTACSAISGPTPTPDVRPIDVRMAEVLDRFYVRAEDLHLARCDAGDDAGVTPTCWQPVHESGMLVAGPSMTANVFADTQAYAASRGWLGVWVAFRPYAGELLSPDVGQKLLSDAGIDASTVMAAMIAAMDSAESWRLLGSTTDTTGEGAMDFEGAWLAPDRSYEKVRRQVGVRPSTDGGRIYSYRMTETITVGAGSFFREWEGDSTSSRNAPPGTAWRKEDAPHTTTQVLPATQRVFLRGDRILFDQTAYQVTGRLTDEREKVQPFFIPRDIAGEITWFVDRETFRLVSVDFVGVDGSEAHATYVDYDGDVSIEAPDVSTTVR